MTRHEVELTNMRRGILIASQNFFSFFSTAIATDIPRPGYHHTTLNNNNILPSHQMNPKATRKNKSTNLVSLCRVCLRLLFIIRCAFCIHSVVAAMGGDAMKAIWHFKRISDDERPSPANENFPFLIAALSFILSIFKDLQADSRSRMLACLHFFCVCMKNGYMRDCVMKKKGES